MATAVAYSCLNTVFAATAGAKTVLVAAAPAGHGLTLVDADISFDGVTASAIPATVELCQLTLATAGTAGASPPAAVQCRGRATAGTAPTVTHNYTAEPTVVTVVKRWYIAPTSGMVYPLPLGREIECDSSAGTIKALAIRVNVSAAVNILATMEVENL